MRNPPAPLSERYGPWAIVTGASSGIGREFALQLASHGMNLILVARGETRLQAVASECEAAGVETLVCVADLSNPGGIDMVEQSLGDREAGLLVNNAGMIARGAFHEIDRERQHQMMYLNSIAPVMLTRAVLPAMIARNRGAVVMVSSTSTRYFHPHMATYAVSKSVCNNLGEYLSWELKAANVDCLVVTPGATATGLFEAGDMNITNESLPAGYSLQPAARVVQRAIAALGRKESIVVTSFAERVTMFLNACLPAKLMRFIIASAAG